MVKTEKEQCTGCGACANICPKGAIKMKQDEKGFFYPEIQTDKCVECGLCEKVCPKDIKSYSKASDNAFLFVNRSIEARKNSSSGGAFSVLANAVVNEGGYVLGAEFADDYSVQHNVYNDKEHVKRFQTSKYVQSNVGSSYEKVYELLKNGSKVLFSGTPCQVSALVTYLKVKNCATDNLLTVDFICHGVGSPDFWQKCLDHYSKNGKKPIAGVNFRGKPKAGKFQNLNIKYSSGRQFYSPSTNLELFYYHFLKNYILRESCYDCKYSAIERVSDITLADCFKFKPESKELNDGFGVSFMLMNSEKAMNYVEAFRKSGNIMQVNKKDYVQPNLKEATPKPGLYDEFWKKYIESGFSSALAVSKYSSSKTQLKKAVATVAYVLGIDSLLKKLKKN